MTIFSTPPGWLVSTKGPYVFFSDCSEHWEVHPGLTWLKDHCTSFLGERGHRGKRTATDTHGPLLGEEKDGGHKVPRGLHMRTGGTLYSQAQKVTCLKMQKLMALKLEALWSPSVNLPGGRGSWGGAGGCKLPAPCQQTENWDSTGTDWSYLLGCLCSPASAQTLSLVH